MRLRLIISGFAALSMAATWMACTVKEEGSSAQGSGGAATAGTGNGTGTSTGTSTGTGQASSSVQSSTGTGATSSTTTGGGMGTAKCNPVTNEPCNTAGGEACDATQDGGFQCFPPPNEKKICETCSPSSDEWCAGSLTCGPGSVCHRWCCTDEDCKGGTCSGKGNYAIAPDLGYCTGGNGGGAGGAGGAGGGMTNPGGATCDVPAAADAPSKGSCVMVTP